MSEKGKAIINTLLCGLYMAVLRIPATFLLAFMTYRSDTNMMVVLVLLILVGLSVLSGYAHVSEKALQAGIKWLVSMILSIGFLPLLQLAFDTFDYNGYHVGFPLLIMVMAMGASDFCAGVLGSGPPPNSRRWVRSFPWEASRMRPIPHEMPKVQKLSKMTEKMQKLVCPIVCAVIVVSSIVVICIIHLG